MAIVCFALAANALHFADPKALPAWEGVNTKFGALALGRVDPVTEYLAAQWIQQHSLSASAKVIVFPETVVPTWTAATEAFWQQTLDRLGASGKTILFGARVPVGGLSTASSGFNFSVDLVALRADLVQRRLSHPHVRLSPSGYRYKNTVLVRGDDTAIFAQRVPVPIAMWNPFRPDSAIANPFSTSIVPVAGERVAILICYEQLLTWTALRSLAERPTVLVAVANDHWAQGTPVPDFQLASVHSWSRLFGIPAITATNR